MNVDEYTRSHHILNNLTLELNTTCNLRCEHCYIDDYSIPGLPTESVKEIIKQARNLGLLCILLTGGEIFVREDIFDIISFARNNFLKVYLISNCTLLNSSNLRRLKNLNIFELGTSLYSMNPKIHDSITGTKGSHAKTFNSIMLAKELGISVAIKCPLMKQNMDSLPEVIMFCESNHIQFESTSFITPKNDGNLAPTRYQLTDCQIENYYAKYYFPYFYSTDGLLTKTKLDDYLCPDLSNSLYINARGEVFPCNSFLYKVGDLQQNSLSEIWNSSRLKKIAELKHRDIKECLSCALIDNCSYCPGQSYYASGNLLIRKVTQKQSTNQRCDGFCRGKNNNVNSGTL